MGLAVSRAVEGQAGVNADTESLGLSVKEQGSILFYWRKDMLTARVLARRPSERIQNSNHHGMAQGQIYRGASMKSGRPELNASCLLNERDMGGPAF